MNLINQLREQLGYPPFIKIDPNTQQLPVKASADIHQKTGQGVLTAVLTAMYQLSRTEEGFGYLLNKDRNIPWISILFGNEAEGVVSAIVSYSGSDAVTVQNSIEEAAKQAWLTSSKALEGKLTYDNCGKYFSAVRNELLHYLPPEIQLGKKLHDNSLDDRTNKMEGPVSGMMHRIEKIFGGPQDHHRDFGF